MSPYKSCRVSLAEQPVIAIYANGTKCSGGLGMRRMKKIGGWRRGRAGPSRALVSQKKIVFYPYSGRPLTPTECIQVPKVRLNKPVRQGPLDHLLTIKAKTGPRVLFYYFNKII
jgi:hypothetical protein